MDADELNMDDITFDEPSDVNQETTYQNDGNIEDQAQSKQYDNDTETETEVNPDEESAPPQANEYEAEDEWAKNENNEDYTPVNNHTGNVVEVEAESPITDTNQVLTNYSQQATSTKLYDDEFVAQEDSVVPASENQEPAYQNDYNFEEPDQIKSYGNEFEADMEVMDKPIPKANENEAVNYKDEWTTNENNTEITSENNQYTTDPSESVVPTAEEDFAESYEPVPADEDFNTSTQNHVNPVIDKG
jgi:hypothetical protein